MGRNDSADGGEEQEEMTENGPFFHSYQISYARRTEGAAGGPER